MQITNLRHTAEYLLIAVNALQRTGNPSELLKGPVAYGAVNGLAAICFWRTSAVGIMTITFLCAGDGLAEVAGRRMGRSNPLPHNPQKVCLETLSSQL